MERIWRKVIFSFSFWTHSSSTNGGSVHRVHWTTNHVSRFWSHVASERISRNTCLSKSIAQLAFSASETWSYPTLNLHKTRCNSINENVDVFGINLSRSWPHSDRRPFTDLFRFPLKASWRGHKHVLETIKLDQMGFEDTWRVHCRSKVFQIFYVAYPASLDIIS